MCCVLYFLKLFLQFTLFKLCHVPIKFKLFTAPEGIWQERQLTVHISLQHVSYLYKWLTFPATHRLHLRNFSIRIYHTLNLDVSMCHFFLISDLISCALCCKFFFYKIIKLTVSFKIYVKWTEVVKGLNRLVLGINLFCSLCELFNKKFLMMTSLTERRSAYYWLFLIW